MLVSANLLDVRQLRYFLAAAECGSFRGAGAALNVQPSSVSRGVRDLEAHLGAPLFRRYNGGVLLTSAGKRFLHPARVAMGHLRDGMRDVDATRECERGHIRVGIFSSLASGFLAETFRFFERQHPTVCVHILEGDPEEHISAVRSQQIDVAFAAGTSQHVGCSSKHLWSEQIFGVVPTAHPLSSRELLSWSDMANEVFIFNEGYMGRELASYTSARLFSFGNRPEFRYQNVCRDNLMALVAIGLGLTVTCESTTAASFPGIIYRPISGEMLPFSAVWSEANQNSPLQELLAEMDVLAATKQQPSSPFPMVAQNSFGFGALSQKRGL